MRKVNLLLVISVVAIFAISCKSITEKATEKMVESIVGHDTDINVDEDGNGTITITGENGEEVTLSANVKDIPDNFPDDVYLIKGDVIVVSSMNTGGGDMTTISMHTDGNPAEVAKEIADNMQNNGWETKMNTTTPEASMIIFAKEKMSATITIGEDDGKTAVSYMVTNELE